MRNTKRHIILLLFSILLLSSCDKNQQYPPLLVQADSAYMRGDYQLADSLLGSYNVSSEGQSQDALMYYQLLGLCKKFVRAAITSKELSRADSVEHFYSQSQLVFFGYKHKKEEEIEREKLLRKEEQHRYMLSVDRIKENNSHIAILLLAMLLVLNAACSSNEEYLAIESASDSPATESGVINSSEAVEIAKNFMAGMMDITL